MSTEPAPSLASCHAKRLRMRVSGVGIKSLLPTFVTVWPNGETLHMANRATRFTPS